MCMPCQELTVDDGIVLSELNYQGSFLGGLTRGRGSWRGGSDTYRERGSHAEDEWQVTRGSRRSYHDLDDVRGVASHERLPEWSNDDSDDFNTPGTFDSSGAFVLHKVNQSHEIKFFVIMLGHKQKVSHF